MEHTGRLELKGARVESSNDDRDRDEGQEKNESTSSRWRLAGEYYTGTGILLDDSESKLTVQPQAEARVNRIVNHLYCDRHGLSPEKTC
jgi:hypothetical protein